MARDRVRAVDLIVHKATRRPDPWRFRMSLFLVSIICGRDPVVLYVLARATSEVRINRVVGRKDRRRGSQVVSSAGVRSFALSEMPAGDEVVSQIDEAGDGRSVARRSAGLAVGPGERVQ